MTGESKFPEAPLSPPHLRSGHKLRLHKGGLLPRPGRGQGAGPPSGRYCQVITRGRRGPRPQTVLSPHLLPGTDLNLPGAGESEREVPETHLRAPWELQVRRAERHHSRKPTKGGSTSSSRAPPPSSAFPARSILVLSRSSGG